MNHVEDMRNDSGIREKNLGDGISSFNFTSKTFKKGNWNDRTIKARGLFVDTDTDRILARSYNKFFNIGERPETNWESLRENLVFPVTPYIKENGFLGIASMGKDGKLFLASKSSNQGEFAEYFKNIMDKTLSEEEQDYFAQLLGNNNCSAVFEVIDVEHDRHIVDYFESHLVLLDIIYNDYEYSHAEYSALEHVSKRFGFEIKQRLPELNSFKELEAFYLIWRKRTNIEGMVLEDANGFMFKMKFDWYKYWKGVRGIIQQLASGKHEYEIRNYHARLHDETLAAWLPDYCFNFKMETGKAPHVIDVRHQYWYYCDDMK
jgi:tRNA splicing ligase